MNSFQKITNYDNIAKAYIDHAENERSWNNLYERPYMLSAFDDFKNKQVLDAGCGTGFYSLYAGNQNANVTAVDASNEMLEYVKSKDDSGKIRLIKADIAAGFPFLEDSSQDYIICSLVLHYVENWEKPVEELYRVLRKKGKLYVSTHHPFNDFVHLGKESYFDKYLVKDRWGSKGNSFEVRYFTRSLTDLMEPFLRSKFKILKIEEPLPVEACKKKDPEAYDFFNSNPAFIFLILEK